MAKRPRQSGDFHRPRAIFIGMAYNADRFVHRSSGALQPSFKTPIGASLKHGAGGRQRRRHSRPAFSRVASILSDDGCALHGREADVAPHLPIVTKDIAPGFVIEAALLTSPKPLKIGELARLFANRYTKDRIAQELGRLVEFWADRGLRLVEVGDGWRFQSAPEISGYLVRLVEEKAPKYSRAVMETLAIIAYRQPATRGDIEEIRGVAVNPNILRQLEERGWIEIIGHRESPGRPALFATTPQFLNDLGIRSLSALPPLKGEAPQAQEFELDFSDEKIQENLSGQEATKKTPETAAPSPADKAAADSPAAQTTVAAETKHDDEKNEA